MFGEGRDGRWVRETSPRTLRDIVRPLVRNHLGMGDFSSCLYCDEIMALRGGRPVGMPYCGGYACGYTLIRHYLKKTGASVYEATVTPTGETLRRRRTSGVKRIDVFRAGDGEAPVTASFCAGRPR